MARSQAFLRVLWHDLCVKRACVTDVDFFLPLSTVFTLLLTRGDILSMHALFLLSLSSQPITFESAVRMSAGEASDRYHSKKASLFAKDNQQKAFDGMKCPACHPPPHTSHYHPVWFPLQCYAGLKHLAAVSQRERGCGRGHRGAVLADCWQTSHRGPITFPACQEGVNPRGGRPNIRLNGN